MDIERYAAVFKALLDNQGVENKVGSIDDDEGMTYVIECGVDVDSRHYAIDCCFGANKPVLVVSPQIVQVSPAKRSQVLEACNAATIQCLQTRFVVNDDGWLEARSWSIYLAFEEEDFTGDVAMETIELYEEMADSLQEHLGTILAAAK